MTVNLPPELEALVTRKVADGSYESESEVLRAALKLLEEHGRSRAARVSVLRAKAAAGFADLDAGRCSELSADDIIRLARERYLR